MHACVHMRACMRACVRMCVHVRARVIEGLSVLSGFAQSGTHVNSCVGLSECETAAQTLRDERDANITRSDARARVRAFVCISRCEELEKELKAMGNSEKFYDLQQKVPRGATAAGPGKQQKCSSNQRGSAAAPEK